MRREDDDQGCSLPLTVELRNDKICMRFEAAWQPAPAPRMEEYLGDAEGPERAALLRELLRVELEFQRQRGSLPAVEEYLTRFPGHDTLVREEFEAGAAQAESADRPEHSTDTGADRNGGSTRITVRGPASEVNIPGYEVHERLGRGAMGIVYEALQVNADRQVALKVIRGGEDADPAELQRFRHESKAAARLKHPNIAQIFDVGEYNGLPYFSMELCGAGSLDRYLRGGPLTPADAAELVETLARAMHYAHQKGIIHRDLKPANILLSLAPAAGDEMRAAESSAEEGRVSLSSLLPKVGDFGLARKLDTGGQTQTGAVMGTPSYMPPEQAAGRNKELGPACDTYALGAILYECLTGRPPFKAATALDTLLQVISEEPVPPAQLNARVPRDLQTICLKCLHKKPHSRYGSAQDLADDLRRYLDRRPILARPVGKMERLLLWVKRSPMQAAALAATLALVAMGITTLLVGMDRAIQTAELTKAKLDAQTQEIAEQKRLSGVRDDIEKLYARAENERQQKDWIKLEETARTALALIASEPTFTFPALRQPAEQFLSQAEGENASVRLREAERTKLPRLQGHHGDAVFFTTPFTGLELAENFTRVREAVKEGLALFAVTAEGSGPPSIDRRFFNDAEVQAITALCYELLWLHAEALAQVRVGEKEEVVKERLRQSLTLLDRADRLGLGAVYGGLVRRAVCLEYLGRKDEAAQVRQRAAEVPPDLAADFFLQGLEQYRRQEFGAAVPLLAMALKKQTGHYGAEYLLAVCRVNEGRYQEAKEGLTRCLKQRPDFSWPRLLLGFAEMKLNNPAAALAEYDVVLRDPPDPMARYVAHVNRGVLAVEQRRWDAAAPDFEQAVAINPNAFAAHLNLAVMHKQRAELGWRESVLHLGLGSAAGLSEAALADWKRSAWQTAVDVLDRAIARRDNVAVLYQERTRLHLRLGNAEQARTDLARAVVLAPAGASSRLAADLLELGRLLNEGSEYRQAEVVLDGLLQLQPGHALAWRLKAQALLGQKRHRESGAALDRYLALAPEKVSPRTAEQTRRLSESYRARGLIHEQLNAFQEAADCYTRGLEVERDPILLSLRGWMHLLLEAPKLARADFEEALAQRKDNADALLGRAEALVRLGKWEIAVEEAERGLKLSARAKLPLYRAARVYTQAYIRLAAEKSARTRNPAIDRTRERAVELLRRALSLVPALERRQFWRDYVERDPAMALLSQDPGLRDLAYENRPVSE